MSTQSAATIVSTVDQSATTKPVLTLSFSSRKRARESSSSTVASASAKKTTKVKSEITATATVTAGDESGDVTTANQNPNPSATAASLEDGNRSDYDLGYLNEEKLKLKSRLHNEDEAPRTVTICVGKFNTEADAQRAYKKVFIFTPLHYL